jgi:hypothetical protein
MNGPIFRKIVLDALNQPRSFHPLFRFAIHPIIFWPRTPTQARRRCTHRMHSPRIGRARMSKR